MKKKEYASTWIFIFYFRFGSIHSMHLIFNAQDNVNEQTHSRSSQHKSMGNTTLPNGQLNSRQLIPIVCRRKAVNVLATRDDFKSQQIFGNTAAVGTRVISYIVCGHWCHRRQLDAISSIMNFPNKKLHRSIRCAVHSVCVCVCVCALSPKKVNGKLL